MKKVIRDALVATLPVLMGYLSMGIAFGILLAAGVPGANAGTAFAMSASTISGSMQFAAVEMLRNDALYPLWLTVLLAAAINIRYVMYGFPFLRTFANYPWYLRWYLTIALTDETYAIMAQNRRHGRTGMVYCFCVAFCDHLYWIAGSVIGAAAGSFITFNTAGIEFAMAALFLVILTDLCRERPNRLPAVIGALATAVTLAFFAAFCPRHANKMLLPAMVLTIGTLLALRKKLTSGGLNS